MIEIETVVGDMRSRVVEAVRSVALDTGLVQDDELLIAVSEDAVVEAVLAAIDDEAVGRMAQHYVDDTHLRSMDFRNGAVMKLKPAQDMAALWVAAAKTMLGDAENYSETEVGLPSVSMDVKLAGEFEMFTLTVQRARKITPHEARLRAEEQRTEARDLARALWSALREAAEDYGNIARIDPDLDVDERLPYWLTGVNGAPETWLRGADFELPKGGD